MGQAFDAVAAVFGDSLSQFTLFSTQSGAALFDAFEVRLLTLDIRRPRDYALVEQLHFQGGKVGLKSLATQTPLHDLMVQFRMAVAVGDQRSEQLDLSLGLQHRVVRPVKVVEMLNQRLDARLHIEWLQHTRAHEVGQVIDRFHGDGFVKEIHRLFVVNAHATPKPRAIGREAV